VFEKGFKDGVGIIGGRFIEMLVLFPESVNVVVSKSVHVSAFVSST
jgi:hypothetical protein